jgi:hypothetical protein
LPDIVDVLGPRPFDMKESLKEYLSELRERATMDENLSQEERDAEIAKLKALQDSAKFDPNAKEDDDNDEPPNGEEKRESDKADGNENITKDSK